MPDKKVEVFRLDLPGVPSSRRGPRFTAFENDLYALTVPIVAGMEQHAVERHFLRHVDDLAAKVLQKLATDGLSALSRDERSDWARFLMSLRLRQPELIRQLCDDSAQHLESSLRGQLEEYEAEAEAGDPPTFPEWVESRFPGLIENFGLSFFHSLVDNPEIGEKILRMKWWLWDFSSANHDLLLADHPCIVTKGIDEPDTIIALPIGPRRAFMATNSDRTAKIMRRQRPQDLLKHMNASSLGQARVRIYARNTMPATFISNRIHGTRISNLS